MRVALFAIFVSLVPLASGCGGTSSETPWPKDPEGKTLGPAGESGPAEEEDNSARTPENESGARTPENESGARTPENESGARASDKDGGPNITEP